MDSCLGWGALECVVASVAPIAVAGIKVPDAESIAALGKYRTTGEENDDQDRRNPVPVGTIRTHGLEDTLWRPGSARSPVRFTSDISAWL